MAGLRKLAAPWTHIVSYRYSILADLNNQMPDNHYL